MNKNLNKHPRPASKKYFTPEQANRMLPLVRAVVGDIVALAGDLRDRHDRMQRIRPGKRGGPTAAHEEEYRDLELEWGRDAARIEEYVDELRKLGVELKGWDGLIDFPGLMDGREVCLCWKLGEPELMYWHEVEAGFAGRQPLAFDADPSLEVARSHS